MNDGNTFNIALCKNCSIEPEEYKAAMDCIREYWDLHGFEMSFGDKEMPKDWAIESVVGRQDFKDVMTAAQGGRCYRCHEELGSEWIATNGYLAHEFCESKNEVIQALR